MKIGITLDFEQGKKGQYSIYPYYVLRENYANAVEEFGATPILMSYDINSVDKYIDIIDGLIVTGGDFDVSPALYGNTKIHDTVQTKDKRTAFEIAITKKALSQNKPILGICGGQQLLNVILGGSLIQHIPDTIKNPIEHEQPTPRNELYHDVIVEKNTMLYDIVKKEKFMVNSAHHQAVLDVGKDVKINAVAPDGVIEGIEYTKHPFCLGIQWHPEFLISENDRAIFRACLKSF